MKSPRQRKCKNCKEFFLPDPRNLRHQHFCGKPECRKASKKASQRRWLNKSQNRGYFRGAANVERVRDWRKAHPGYWRRSKASSALTALQDVLAPQPPETKEKSPTLAEFGLQDLLQPQAAVLIGLIANLTGSTLQEEIAFTARRYQQLGQDIIAGITAGGCDAQTRAGSFPDAPGPPSIQLGGSALGT